MHVDFSTSNEEEEETSFGGTKIETWSISLIKHYNICMHEKFRERKLGERERERERGFVEFLFLQQNLWCAVKVFV